MLGNALSFSGSNEAYLLNVGSPIPTGPPITMFVNVAPDSSGEGCCLSLWNGSDTNFYYLGISEGSNVATFTTRAGTAPSQVNRTHSLTVTAGTWYNLVASLDASDNWSVRANAGETTGNTSYTAPTGIDSLVVGAATNVAANMEGDISLWAVWDAVLGVDDRAALGAGAHPVLIQPDSLVHWGYVQGTTLIDAMTGSSWTVNGSPSAAVNGARVFLPTGPIVGVPTVAAASPIAGATSIAWSAAGAITGTGALAAAASVAFSEASTLTGTGALAGAESVAFTSAGAVTGTGALAGVASIDWSEGALATATGALTAAATIAWSATGTAAIMERAFIAVSSEISDVIGKPQLMDEYPVSVSDTMLDEIAIDGDFDC